MIKRVDLILHKNLTSEKTNRYKDYHRAVHNRNQVVVKKEIKKIKIHREKEMTHWQTQQIVRQKKTETLAVERYRLLNII